jgi:hypothetical protein
MSYDPYSRGLKCKWCGRKIMDHMHDRQCDGCWEFITRLDHALKTPKLFEMLKSRMKDRIAEIQEEENAEAEKHPF